MRADASTDEGGAGRLWIVAESFFTGERSTSLSSKRAAEEIGKGNRGCLWQFFCNPLYAGEEGLHDNHAYFS